MLLDFEKLGVWKWMLVAITVAVCVFLLLPIVFPATMYGLFILIFVLSGETWR